MTSTTWFGTFCRPKAAHWFVPLLSSVSHEMFELKDTLLGFPGGAVVKSPPADAGDTGSSPGPGRSHMPWSN